MELRDTVLNLAMPLLEAEGLELWGLDIVPGPVLKVILYVDVPHGEHPMEDSPSASIDQCESISRQLSLAMDVEDCIDQPWALEVSSPGLERKFFSLPQLRPYIGDIIDVRLKSPVSGSKRKTWRGRLLAVGDASLELEPVSVAEDGRITPEGQPAVELDWKNIAKAQRVHLFAQPQRPGKNPASRR